MIDKKQAKAKGVEIIDSNETLASGTAVTIDQLKALLPNVIDSDNCVDVNALRDLLTIANTTSNDKGYELTFAGKGLARAEADRATRYELHAKKDQSKRFEDTQNVVIRGDNIEALKILYQNYHKKIKMIYIDPPYNTKSENFIYKDNFKQSDKELIKYFGLNEDTSDFLNNVLGTRSHSGWLSFMYPRLKLARELLADDGVIFISIDDNEQANLKIICDEIFGVDNFISTIIPIVNPGGRDYKQFAITHEYIMTYSKYIDTSINEIPKDTNFKYQDNSGGFELRDLRNRNPKFHKGNRPNLFYSFFVNPSIKNSCGYCLVSLEKSAVYSIQVQPYNSTGKESVWRWGKKKSSQNIFLDDFDNSQILAKQKVNGEWNIYEKNRRSTTKAKSNWDETGMRTEDGTRRINALFNENYFDHPKATLLVKKCCILGMNDNDIILDFFAGSGTTGDAVMQLNAEDGGNRKFIMVQLDETIDKAKNTEAYEFCTENKFEPVISSITIERLNRAGEKIKQEHLAKDTKMFDTSIPVPDIGYKVYSLIKKPEILQKDTGGTGKLFKINTNRRGSLDTLTNMLCTTCKPLDTKIECIVKDCLYKAGGAIYLLGNIDSERLADYADYAIHIDGWADINLENYLNLDVIDKDNVTVIY